MNIKLVINLLGSLCIIIGAAMLPSMIISFYDTTTSFAALSSRDAFALSITLSVLLGLFLKYAIKPDKSAVIGAADGFGVTAFGWMIAAFLGALPYIFICYSHGNFSFTEAYFESMSGFTTTGSSVFGTAIGDGGYGRIESLPQSLLLWRSMTHWLGGMGIVVLALAILPALKAGGYQLFSAEVPGPTADRLQPRIRETAAVLWGAYCVLTLFEIFFLSIGGMPIFDSICHTFGTVATGGFSTKDASIGHYALVGDPSALYFEVVITVFMFLAGCNFLLHYHALHGKPRVYWRNAEFRFYFYIALAIAAILALLVYLGGVYDYAESLRQAVFQTLSIMTTTGFATTDTNVWPAAAKLLLLVIMFFGGCAGSTGGGLKQIRIYVMWKYAIRELARLLRPSMVNRVRIGKDLSLDERAAMGIIGLVVLWFIVFAVCSLLVTLLLQGSGLAENSFLVTSVSSVAACLNNIGPGFAAVGSTENFHWMPSGAKILLTFCMLLGRLEIYSVLVLLLPLAWRK